MTKECRTAKCRPALFSSHQKNRLHETISPLHQRWLGRLTHRIRLPQGSTPTMFNCVPLSWFKPQSRPLARHAGQHPQVQHLARHSGQRPQVQGCGGQGGGQQGCKRLAHTSSHVGEQPPNPQVDPNVGNRLGAKELYEGPNQLLSIINHPFAAQRG